MDGWAVVKMKRIELLMHTNESSYFWLGKDSMLV